MAVEVVTPSSGANVGPGMVQVRVLVSGVPISNVIVVKAGFLDASEVPSDPLVISQNSYVGNLSRDPQAGQNWVGFCDLHGLTGGNVRFCAWAVVSTVHGRAVVAVTGQGGM
jgi:hypothetical protein